MKLVIYIVAAVLLTGMWFGINLAKDKPLLSNPFADEDLQERAADAAKGVARDLLEESKRAIDKQLKAE